MEDRCLVIDCLEKEFPETKIPKKCEGSMYAVYGNSYYFFFFFLFFLIFFFFFFFLILRRTCWYIFIKFQTFKLK